MWENALVFWYAFLSRMLLLLMCVATIMRGNYIGSFLLGAICLLQFLFVESQVRDPRFEWVDAMNKTLRESWNKLINFLTGYKL